MTPFGTPSRLRGKSVLFRPTIFRLMFILQFYNRQPRYQDRRRRGPSEQGHRYRRQHELLRRQ